MEAVDDRKTYMNTVTAKTPEGARIPITVDTDREALELALALCVRTEPAAARILRIRSTKHLEHLFVSEAALADVLAGGRCELLEPPHEIAFDAAGMLAEELAVPA